MSLTNAMRQRQCGAVIGPSGVGKTETVKELANFMGQNVVTLDCAVDSSIVTVGRFLSGAVQSGSWLLLDNADRLTHGLMAVVSQQLEYLCHAYHILQDTNCLYSKRGASKHDYKNPEPASPKRRHSLATLHSSQVRGDSHTRRPTIFPAATNEKHGPSKFDDVFGDYEEECEVGQFGKRRHSISRSQYTQEDHYDSDVPTVPLFVEMQGPAMIRRPASRDSLTDSPEFSPLQQWTYKPENCGYVSFDSRMVLANVNYNCFMTINTGDALAHPIPESLKEAPMLAVKLCQLSKMVQHTAHPKSNYH
nr:uncharacterized protein LOC129274896 [Lytechinus pictus]